MSSASDRETDDASGGIFTYPCFGLGGRLSHRITQMPTSATTPTISSVLMLQLDDAGTRIFTVADRFVRPLLPLLPGHVMRLSPKV
jgi:hypothetical protein